MQGLQDKKRPLSQVVVLVFGDTLSDESDYANNTAHVLSANWQVTALIKHHVLLRVKGSRVNTGCLSQPKEAGQSTALLKDMHAPYDTSMQNPRDAPVPRHHPQARKPGTCMEHCAHTVM